ncbi:MULTISPECIES: alanine--tRNA ligase [unclassified Fusibacter]|uniref:alanine--tRNA ligase n=1 Tax=unclassified Fusibacter TaxID=2624464 RepID=UPI001010F084|nr:MULTISPECIES: alanine--tRNA ligase [unclassified Fusibacter]MCK8058919.1 alanine--tRNA ligase [Fusibacter sp. A2]NPE21994.1 alanine--tRNA ligase [Fusibacter sp. A1]RXV61560.1 alanine--tRNA ligase [Fusibacter sp. A1]
MKTMSLNEIRKRFLDYFERNGHLVQPSYPLVPQSDKTLLLINAGMVPLKDFFTGVQEPPSKNMATCQKCIRTNDIDNVGHTSRHASFFEMLGNFAFGDYFKKEAIRYSWEFITQELELSLDKLWVTVYLEDDEAYDIWLKQENVPADRIVRLGKEDNFWEIGTGTGPCGPCSEIYYDRGEAYGCGDPDCKPGCDCDRFVEFWNLVFTQFEKDEKGEMTPLKNPNIDTGMGLERIACLMQDVTSIFDIDTMVHIRNQIAQRSGKVYGADHKTDTSIRIITDHIRAVTFLVTDGVMPNNEGRGYVLRRLLRRAARHGRLIGIQGAFLFELVDTVIEVFGEAYPELIARQDYTKKVIAIEEDRFEQTIDQGLTILEGYIKDTIDAGKNVLTGELAFKLYDTYGFPLDLTLEIVKEHQLSVDEKAFESEMEAQKERARSSRDSDSLGWSGDATEALVGLATEFVGYEKTQYDATVIAILKDGQLVDELSGETKGLVVLDCTPFYAESGGQSGDTGVLTSTTAKLMVTDTQKAKTGTILHHVSLIEGSLKKGDMISAEVGEDKRLDIARNHTATHLLHQALKDVLGGHIEQAGSLVEVDRLRFDFTHFQGLSFEEVSKVEQIVNEKVFLGMPVTVEELPIAEAKKRGAMALFGEKYGELVRMVTIGDYSMELCGGTHLKHASEIGLFKITSEAGVAAGVRRIEAITGRGVYHYLNQVESILDDTVTALKSKREDVVQKAVALVDENKTLTREFTKMKQAVANASLSDIEKNAQIINGTKVIVVEFEDQEQDVLRNIADQMTSKEEAVLVVIANVTGDKVNFIAKANESAVKNSAHCGNIVRELAKACGGGGGGRPNMAQAGGKDASKLKDALALLPTLV